VTLVIFGVGVFVFFITVYGIVVAGGLQLSVYQVRDQPDLADQAGFGKKRADDDIPESDITSTEI
jgi:hypothetical protein